MISRAVQEIRYTAAAVVSWASVIGIGGAVVVSASWWGLPATVGVGAAGIALVLWVIDPLVSRLQGTAPLLRRRNRRPERAAGCRDCGRGCPARRGRGRCDCNCPTSTPGGREGVRADLTAGAGR